jgi:hypothetical protein
MILCGGFRGEVPLKDCKLEAHSRRDPAGRKEGSDLGRCFEGVQLLEWAKDARKTNMRLVVDFISHKFDINVDAEILDLLDQHILNLSLGE